jgi:adenylate kinase
MAQQQLKAILMFGAPGVGKGTQGKMLGQSPGFHHMATGDIFRSLDKNSPEGREFVSYSSRGLLVPDELTIRLWKSDVERRIRDGRYAPQRDLLVLDGIPRSVAQARALRDHVDVAAVIHLVAPDESEMVKRIKRRAVEEGRHDDASESVILERFAEYERKTRPVLDQYDSTLIHEVDALGSPQEVLDRIRAALADCPG